MFLDGISFSISRLEVILDSIMESSSCCPMSLLSPAMPAVSVVPTIAVVIHEDKSSIVSSSVMAFLFVIMYILTSG